MKQQKGLVFDIQRYCLHDGPGIRTVVFFKGCPLRCEWCANPESLNFVREIGFNKNDCIGCYRCVKACNHQAMYVGESGIVIDKKKCTQCFECVKCCPTGALTVFGEWYTTDAVLEIVMKDAMFYKNSGGGVTLSGGEVLRQSRFASQLLKKIKDYGIHTAIETSGYAAWQALECVLQYTDLIIFDVKHVDRDLHLQYIGVDNQRILDNLKKIKELKKPMIVRIPMIPTVNMDDQSIDLYIRKLTEIGIYSVNLLPFHQLGQPKYKMMGMPYTFTDIKPPTDGEMEAVGKRMESSGIQVKIGG